MLPWLVRMVDTHITVKELAPVVVAAAIRGARMARKNSTGTV